MRSPVHCKVAARAAAVPERNIEQDRHGIGRDVVEQKTVENIEAPSQPGGKQHRPLVCVHIEQRAALGGRTDGLALSDFSLDHEGSPFQFGDWGIGDLVI